jgi:hypothetical protein
MKGCKQGMAGIFDAFVFLGIASLVSVSMLTAFAAPSPLEEERQQRVEDSLTVLLRTTVKDADGNARALQDLLLTGRGADDGTEEEIALTLELLLPGWEWTWSARRSGIEIAVVSTSAVVPEGTVYCSIVRETLQGEVVEYRLEAWLT